jgi:hypothetical protein
VPIKYVQAPNTTNTYPCWDIGSPSGDLWQLALTITDWPASGIVNAEDGAGNKAYFYFSAPNFDNIADAGTDWYSGDRAIALTTPTNEFDAATGVVSLAAAGVTAVGLTGLTAPTTAGLAIFSFNIPVKALADVADNKSRIWWLRNGLSNADIDVGDYTTASNPPDGTEKQAAGAGILLDVGGVASSITVPTP